MSDPKLLDVVEILGRDVVGPMVMDGLESVVVSIFLFLLVFGSWCWFLGLVLVLVLVLLVLLVLVLVLGESEQTLSFVVKLLL